MLAGQAAWREAMLPVTLTAAGPAAGQAVQGGRPTSLSRVRRICTAASSSWERRLSSSLACTAVCTSVRRSCTRHGRPQERCSR